MKCKNYGHSSLCIHEVPQKKQNTNSFRVTLIYFPQHFTEKGF